jgi:ubiquinone/menaquinone biosynthesis C-methylase UbiE
MTSRYKKITEANRAAWNEVTPKHQKAAKEAWDKAFMQPGYICLGDTEIDLLTTMGLKEKAVAHLCCNNGVELLSLKNLGAGKCVGFDISDAAIQEARERAERSQIDCQFIRSDVYEIGLEYDNQFDLVYISSGAIGWIPDLNLFFAKAAALLRNNGQTLIHEIHPFSEMLPFDGPETDDLLRIVEPYFKDEPYIEYGGLDYVGGEDYPSDIPQYWFVHKISDIIMGLVENQISLKHFSESEIDISAGHQQIENAGVGIPLSYILIGKKKKVN